MIFFIDVIKAIIYLIFPILIYNLFENSNINKESNQILKISLFLSVFLFITFVDNHYIFLIANIPILIAYLKKYYKLYTIINFIFIIYISTITNTSIYLLLFQYILLFIVLCFTKQKVKLFTLTNTYFYSFILFYNYRVTLISKDIIKILIIIALNYILTKIIKYITIEQKNKYKKLEEEYRTYLFKFIHEVKNPLSVCKGYIEIINNKQKKYKKEYLKIIDKEIKESLDIMDEYLMLGRLNVELEYMDITLLLEEIYNDFKIYMKENDIDFSYLCNEDELIILGDYKKLKQVFKNIIKNSIESKKENRKLKIIIKTETKEKNVVIKIEDNGIGIENLGKIGSKFYTTKKNGTGLGIHFSKTIVSLHNGSIDYISNDLGTISLISIPIIEI